MLIHRKQFYQIRMTLCDDFRYKLHAKIRKNSVISLVQ